MMVYVVMVMIMERKTRNGQLGRKRQWKIIWIKLRWMVSCKWCFLLLRKIVTQYLFPQLPVSEDFPRKTLWSNVVPHPRCVPQGMCKNGDDCKYAHGDLDELGSSTEASVLCSMGVYQFAYGHMHGHQTLWRKPRLGGDPRFFVKPIYPHMLFLISILYKHRYSYMELYPIISVF